MALNLLYAAVVGGGVFLLAKKASGATVPASGSGPTDLAADPKATLSGPDGAQSQAGGGVALSAFPAVGNGGAEGTAQTAAIARPEPASGGGVTGRTTGNQGRRSMTFQTSRPLRRNCGSCRETQETVRATLRGLAPDLRF